MQLGILLLLQQAFSGWIIGVFLLLLLYRVDSVLRNRPTLSLKWVNLLAGLVAIALACLWRLQLDSAWALIASAVAVTPLFPVAPFFVGTLWYSSLNYYRVHKKSHMNPAWGEQRIPWHFDHHMGNNPGANWCVTRPWFDYIMGTRVFTEGGVREDNVLGFKQIPAWLERLLPKPESLGTFAPKPAARRAA